MEELNAILNDLAQRVSENSDSSVSNDGNSNHDQTANTHDISKHPEPNSGVQDINKGFKVYSGYGGDYNPTGSNPSSNRPSTVPGTVQSWPEASATWTSTATTTETGMAIAKATVKPKGPVERDVWSSTARTALATPREVGECGRKHKVDTTDWGPGKGWNISTLPVYRSPSSPCNRLFSAIKETRPGREPKALLEWLGFTPQPTPSQTTPAYLRLRMENWNSSTSMSAPPTPGRKSHSVTETSSLENGRSPGRRLWQKQQTVEHASTPSKNAGSAGRGGSKGQQRQQHQPPKPVSKASKGMKDWKVSTRPEWKNTVKWNQFENITETEGPPRVHNKYAGAKARYMTPSKKTLRLKKENELAAQRRDDFRELDMKRYDVDRERRARLAKSHDFARTDWSGGQLAVPTT